MTEAMIKIGTVIEYHANFGHGGIRTAEVVRIEKVGEREKYGHEVAEVAYDDRESCVFDLSDSRWCYGDQIASLKGRN